MNLVVQPPQYPLGAAAVVVLDELVGCACRLVENPLIEALIEEPPRVSKYLGLDQYNIRNSQPCSLHEQRLSINLVFEQAHQVLTIPTFDQRLR